MRLISSLWTACLLLLASAGIAEEPDRLTLQGTVLEVTEEGEAPFASVRVEAYGVMSIRSMLRRGERGESDRRHQALTDAAGRFALELAPGYSAYVVDIDDSHYVLDRPILVMRETPREGITLRARRATFLWGRVLDATNGAPVDMADVVVAVALPKGEGPSWDLAEARGSIEASMSRSVNTHEDGRFQVIVRGGGTVQLAVLSDHHAPHFETLEVQAGQAVKPFEVRLARGTRVEGRLTIQGEGHGLSDYNVTMAGSPFQKELRAVHGPFSFIHPDVETGTFVVGHLPPGSYQLNVWTSRSVPSTQRLVSFEVKEGMETLDLKDIVLHAPGQAEGR